MQDPSTAALPRPLHQGPFVGLDEFRVIVRNALGQADAQGWSTLWLSDPDFEDWPLGERAVNEALNAWAGSGRQLRLLAGRFDGLERQHPRFVVFRRQWSHLIECHQLGGRQGEAVLSAIWTPHWTLQRLDLVRCTGVGTLEAGRRVTLREELLEQWAQARPGFAATTLGL